MFLLATDYEMLLALDESTPPVKSRGSQELVSALPPIRVTAAWLQQGNTAHEVWMYLRNARHGDVGNAYL